MIVRRTAVFSALVSVVFAALVSVNATAEAQTRAAQAGQKPVAEETRPVPEAVAPRPSNAAFMKPLSRLSSILGSVHFLRRLCGDEEAAVWRQKMDELLAAQAPNEADRRILVAAFNGGYRAFESTYRQCTPAARVAVARYQDEGAGLAREISARYGN